MKFDAFVRVTVVMWYLQTRRLGSAIPKAALL